MSFGYGNSGYDTNPANLREVKDINQLHAIVKERGFPNIDEELARQFMKVYREKHAPESNTRRAWAAAITGFLFEVLDARVKELAAKIEGGAPVAEGGTAAVDMDAKVKIESLTERLDSADKRETEQQETINSLREQVENLNQQLTAIKDQLAEQTGAVVAANKPKRKPKKAAKKASKKK